MLQTHVMASQCVVANCTWPENEDGERPSLHRFPWKQPQLARKWVANVIMSGTPAGKITHSSRVCSLHFEKGLRTSECLPSYFKSSDAPAVDTKMGMSNAERQRKYRLNRNQDPEKRQSYLNAEKRRYQQEKEAGKTKIISGMTEWEKQQQRRKWREKKRASRNKEKRAEASETLPGVSTDGLEMHTSTELLNTKMGMSNAEKQRKYRFNRNRDPERRQRYLNAEKRRYQQEKAAGKTKIISGMTEWEKQQQRQKWREKKRSIRNKEKRAEASETLPGLSTDGLEMHTSTELWKEKPKARKKKIKSKKTSQKADTSKVEDKRPVLSKQVVKNGFEKKFISQMTEFWKYNLFCDLQLNIGGIEVMAHQLVFNVAQPFCLRGLETHTVNSVLTVEVPVVTSKEAVDSFISYLYKGSLLITEKTVYEILSLGQFFKFTSIEYFCNSFITAMSRYKTATIAEMSKSDLSPSIKAWKRYHSKKNTSETVTMPTLSKEFAGPDEDEGEEEEIETPILSTFKIEIDVDEKDPVPEGVDETDMYPAQVDEDGKSMRKSWGDADDQEWTLVPNESEDKLDLEEDVDDIEHRGDSSDIPDMPEVKEECRDDDGQDELSRGSSGGKDQEAVNSETDKSGSHELDFDTSKDIKPILLPDGSILETHLSKEDSSSSMDKVDEVEVAQAVELIRKVRMAYESLADAPGEGSEECPQEDNDRPAQDTVSPSIMAVDHEDETILENEVDGQQDQSLDTSKGSEHPTEGDFEDTELDNDEMLEEDDEMANHEKFIEGHSSVHLHEESDNDWESWEPQADLSVDFGVDEEGNPKPDYEEFRHNSIYFKYYKCDRCPSLFTSRVQRQEHVHVVHLGFRYVCKYCGKEMTSPNGLRAHELEHVVENQHHQCKKCDKTFQRKSSLYLHMRRHQVQEAVSEIKQKNPHICKICSESFPSINTLIKHRSKIHKITIPTTAHQSQIKVSPKCPDCDLSFKCVSSMRRHFKAEHPDSVLPTSAQVNWRDVVRANPLEGGGEEMEHMLMVEVQDSVEKEQMEAVEALPKPKRRRTQKPDHVTGTKNFHCQECGMDFSFAASLRRHCKSEHANT